jgi:hypothetical protein
MIEYPYVFDVNAVGLAEGVGASDGDGLAASTVATGDARGVVATVATGAAVEPPLHAARTSAMATYEVGRTIRCMSSSWGMNEV